MGDTDGPEPRGRGSRDTDRRREESSPADEFERAPFDLVTDETRASILRVLASRQAANPLEPTLSFAELREQAGVEDSGNFNYHLDKLQPEYVRQTDEGYALTYAGTSLVGTLRAGVGVDTTRGPDPLDATCSICDTELTAVYEGGLLSVTCENDHSFPEDGLPPNAVAGRDLEEAVALQTRRTQHHCELVRDGVCPACFDDVEREHRVLDEQQANHVVVATCDGCGMVSAAPVGMYLFREPVVVAFYHDHGIDVTETPFWALELTIAEPTVVSEDPLRLSLSVERDGERVTLTVDEHARLLDSERTPVE
jgi:hypothetical protein